MAAGKDIAEANDAVENHLRLLGDGPGCGTATVISVSCTIDVGIFGVSSAATVGASRTAAESTDSAGAGDCGIRTVVGD